MACSTRWETPLNGLPTGTRQSITPARHKRILRGRKVEQPARYVRAVLPPMLTRFLLPIEHLRIHRAIARTLDSVVWLSIQHTLLHSVNHHWYMDQIPTPRKQPNPARLLILRRHPIAPANCL